MKKVLPWFDPDDTQDYFCLMWNITRRCNFNCEFCPFHDAPQMKNINPNHELNILFNHQYQTVNDSKQVAAIGAWIYEHFQKDKKYTQISIFGGEPTQVNDLPIALQICSDVAKQVILYTNLSAPIDDYAFWLKKYPNLVIMSSFHESNMPMHTYLAKVFELNEPDRLITTVMETDPNALLIYRILNLAGYKVQKAKPHRSGQHQYNDLPHEVTTINSKAWHDVVNGEQNCFTDWTCLAGKNNLYIEPSGDVYPCQCMGQVAHTKPDSGISPLFNCIDSPDTNIDFPETICKMKRCRFELFLSKYQQE